jgi:hypothetical protein
MIFLLLYLQKINKYINVLGIFFFLLFWLFFGSSLNELNAGLVEAIASVHVQPIEKTGLFLLGLGRLKLVQGAQIKE